MSRYYNDISYSPAALQHSGVKGMHWHERRYQNEDGTLTEEGRKRYSKSLNKVSNLDEKSHKVTRNNTKYELKHDKAKLKMSGGRFGAIIPNGMGGSSGNAGIDIALYNSLSKGGKKRVVKYSRKANNYQRKIDKANYKSSKYKYKGQKIVNKLNKEFKDVSINDLDEELINKARKYTHTLAA